MSDPRNSVVHTPEPPPGGARAVVPLPGTDEAWVSLPEAAAEVGKSRHFLYKLGALGVLRIGHLAGRDLVTRASLDAYKAQLAAQQAAAPVSEPAVA